MGLVCPCLENARRNTRAAASHEADRRRGQATARRKGPRGRSTFTSRSIRPFHTVKIDRDLVPDGPDRRPLADVITFFHSLDLAVVATHVEGQLTLDRVADLGCDALKATIRANRFPHARS